MPDSFNIIIYNTNKNIAISLLTIPCKAKISMEIISWVKIRMAILLQVKKDGNNIAQHGWQ